MMLDVAIDADGSGTVAAAWADLARPRAEAAIAESAFPQLTQAARTVELSLRLTGDEEVRALNATWRGQGQADQRPVLPDGRSRRARRADRQGPELMLGDIVLARGVCAAEAAEKGDRARATMPRI